MFFFILFSLLKSKQPQKYPFSFFFLCSNWRSGIHITSVPRNACGTSKSICSMTDRRTDIVIPIWRFALLVPQKVMLSVSYTCTRISLEDKFETKFEKIWENSTFNSIKTCPNWPQLIDRWGYSIEPLFHDIHTCIGNGSWQCTDANGSNKVKIWQKSLSPTFQPPWAWDVSECEEPLDELTVQVWLLYSLRKIVQARCPRLVKFGPGR